MFKKLGKALGSSGSKGSKYRFELVVVYVDSLPASVRRCRVQWSRHSKVQTTDDKLVTSGKATFRKKLESTATIAKGESKTYSLKVEVPTPSKPSEYTLIGKAEIDMARYVEAREKDVDVPVTFKVGGTSTGLIRVTVSATMLGDAMSEAGTETSAGLSSVQASKEQDLDGFDDRKRRAQSRRTAADDDESASPGSSAGAGPPAARGTSKSTAIASPGSRRRQVPTVQEEGSDEVGSGSEKAQPVPRSRSRPRGSRGGREEEIKADSDDGGSAPPASRSAAGKPSTSKASAPDPFSKKKPPTASSKKPAPIIPDDDDISPLNSDLDDASPVKAAPLTRKGDSGPARKLGDEEQQSSRKGKQPGGGGLDGMKGALFGTGKAERGEKGPGSKANSSAPVAAGVPEDEDSARALLFGTARSKGAAAAKPDARAKTATAKETGSSKSKAAPALDADEDAARATLFSSTGKGSKAPAAKASAPSDGGSEDDSAARAAAAKGSRASAKPSAAKAAQQAASDDEGESSARASLFATERLGKAAGSSKPAASAAQTKDLAGSGANSLRQDDDDMFGGSMFRKQVRSSAGVAAKSKRAAASSDESDEERAQGTTARTGKASSSQAQDLKQRSRGEGAVGPSPVPPAASKTSDVTELQRRLQEAVTRAEAAENRAAELEASLDEGVGAAELYNQMREMEEKHKKDLLELEDRHLQELTDVKLHHQDILDEQKQLYRNQIEELQQQLEDASRPRDALEQQQAAFAAAQKRAAELEAKLRADLAEAEARAEAAERSVDDSIVMAVKAKDENADLKDEVARLKRQLEEVSTAETMLAASSAAAGVASNVETDLRDEIDRLERENQELELQIAEAQRNAKRRSGTRGRGRPQSGEDDDDDAASSRSASASAAALRQIEREKAKLVEEKASLEQELAEANHTIETLYAKVEKLEGVCGDLEQRAEKGQDEMEARLEGVEEELHEARQRISTLTQQLEEQVASTSQPVKAGASAAELARMTALLSAAEAAQARLSREKAALEEELEEERNTRSHLQERLQGNMRDKGGEDAEAVAAVEAKYQRLKTKYKELEDNTQEEIEALADQLAEAQDEIADLMAQVEDLKRRATNGAGGGGARGGQSREVETLQRENENLVQQLVAKQLEVAELGESEAKLKRELFRLKELNLTLASKASRPEGKTGAGKPPAATATINSTPVTSAPASKVTTPTDSGSKPPKRSLFGRG